MAKSIAANRRFDKDSANFGKGTPTHLKIRCAQPQDQSPTRHCFTLATNPVHHWL